MQRLKGDAKENNVLFFFLPLTSTKTDHHALTLWNLVCWQFVSQVVFLLFLFCLILTLFFLFPPLLLYDTSRLPGFQVQRPWICFAETQPMLWGWAAPACQGWLEFVGCVRVRQVYLDT